MTVDIGPTLARVIARMRTYAFRNPWKGQGTTPVPTQLAALLEPDRPVTICCTFDVGYHASGWWANHEYDACLHISVSHPTDQVKVTLNPVTRELTRIRVLEAPSDAETRAWATAFFTPEHVRKSWLEPPVTGGDPYRMPGVSHVRLFYDRTTMQPIQPTGEVYDLKPWEHSPEKILEGRLGCDVR